MYALDAKTDRGWYGMQSKDEAKERYEKKRR